MDSILYLVVPRGGRWWVVDGGGEGGPFPEKQDAFEAAVRLARDARAQGLDAMVKVQHQPDIGELE